MVWRHPFPGPGLAIRIVGAVSRDRLAVLREADAIVREEVTAAGLNVGGLPDDLQFSLVEPLRTLFKD